MCIICRMWCLSARAYAHLPCESGKECVNFALSARGVSGVGRVLRPGQSIV